MNGVSNLLPLNHWIVGIDPYFQTQMTRFTRLPILNSGEATNKDSNMRIELSLSRQQEFCVPTNRIELLTTGMDWVVPFRLTVGSEG